MGAPVGSQQEQEVFQRDQYTLEHWAIIKGMKFPKVKHQVLHLVQSNAGHWHSFGDQWMETTPAERNLRVLVNSRFNTSWLCALTARRASCIGVYSMFRGDPPSIFSIGAASP